MADAKISALPAVTVPVRTHEIPVNESGTDKKLTSAQLLDLAYPNAGKIAAAYGDGDVGLMLSMINGNFGTPVNPTPTNIGTSVARISYFKLPFDLTVNKIRYFGVGVTTNVYRVAIYKYSDLSRLIAETAFTTASNAWGAIGSGLNVTLTAGVDYFIACSVNATGTTAGVAAFSTAGLANTPQRVTLPSGSAWQSRYRFSGFAGGPGNLGQFAVTGGALPNPAATLAVQAAWAGGMPGFFLDNSNA
jgi:hypothetical protein